MPFCPVCEDEFRPGFTFCRRCNVELVPELPGTARPERANDGVGHIDPIEEGSLALNDQGDYPGWSESDDDRESALPEGLEVAWSLSHVANEVNRLCALLEEQGLTVSVAEMDVVFPWARWREMSAALSFPNDTRNVRLLVAAERVEEAQRIIEEATGDLPFDEDSDEAEYETDDELDHADWPNDEPEIGDMGGPPLADR
jgi:hypothetical protein